MYSVEFTNAVCYNNNAIFKERRSSIMITIKLAAVTEYGMMTSACAF